MVDFRRNVGTLSRTKKVSILSDAKKFRAPSSLSDSCCLEYLEQLDCPRSLMVAMLFKYGEYEQIIELQFDPDNYSTLDDFLPAYRASMLFAKYADFKTKRNRKALARDKLLQTEIECWKTNRRFKDLSRDQLYTGDVVFLHDAVIREIRQVLGVYVPLQEILDGCNWGPGATLDIQRRYSCAANKFQLETGTTKDLYHILFDCGYFNSENGGYSPLWTETIYNGSCDTHLALHPGNRLQYVPKNSKIDRSISIEPGLNSWFQKGVGSTIRRKLAKCGINLSDQRINQDLARKGSSDNTLATVDFSSASDMLAKNMIEAVLSPQWFMLMDSMRSHFVTGLVEDKFGVTYDRYTKIEQGLQVDLEPGEVPLLWEKFSSMGNGFTFELETLVFYAMAKACMKYLRIEPKPGVNFSVYGDDVIIPSEAYVLFSKLSEFYGFKLNSEKSFSSSNFRESCGGHYFRGTNVTPFYLKRELNDVFDIYRMHNAVLLMTRFSYGRDKRWIALCDSLKKAVPKSLRIVVPADFGDVGFAGNFDEGLPVKAKHQIEGYWIWTLQRKSYDLPFEGVGSLLSALWRLHHVDCSLVNEEGSTTRLIHVLNSKAENDRKVISGPAKIHCGDRKSVV